MLLTLLAAGGAALLALGSYRLLERLGRTGWVPAALRGLGWAALAAVLLNPGCPLGPWGAAGRPLVLLDGSLSMTAAGGRWTEARGEALRTGGGEVKLFGDPARALDTLPIACRSLLGPTLRAAVATGRPVVVFTDGEVGDPDAGLAGLLEQTTVRLFPRVPGPAAAVSRLEGPSLVSEPDTVALVVEVTVAGLDPARALVAVLARGGGVGGNEAPVLARGQVALGGGTRGRVTLRFPARRLGAGDHAVTVSLADSLDPERRDDARLHLLRVTQTPGVVLVAAPPDWDARFFYRALREVSSLPVEGYAQLEPNRWRRMADLAPVSARQVERAFLAADLAIRFGEPHLAASQARGRLEWPPARDTARVDWYVEVAGLSPLAGALAGVEADSLPPATALTAGTPPESGWVALTARAGRRGASQPGVWGETRGGTRVVTVLLHGLWRWAFRGGASEEAYRAWVAGLTDWLLGGVGPERAGGTRPRPPIRSTRAVAARGCPIEFSWVGGDPPRATPVRFQPVGGGVPITDSLRFDGAGLAVVYLPPGVYRYGFEAEDATRGQVAVEGYSDEWFPQASPGILTGGTGRAALGEGGGGARRRARDGFWLFGLAVAAFSAEWIVRRRRGLR